MTALEKIRTKSAEELARFLTKHIKTNEPWCFAVEGFCPIKIGSCEDCALEWLNKELRGGV